MTEIERIIEEWFKNNRFSFGDDSDREDTGKYFHQGDKLAKAIEQYYAKRVVGYIGMPEHEDIVIKARIEENYRYRGSSRRIAELKKGLK